MTQSIKKTIVGGATWMSIGAVASKIIGVAYLVIVLSNLSLYQYGVVKLLLSIPPLLGFLNLPGLELAIIADMGLEKGRQNMERMRYIYNSYLSVRYVMGFVGWAVLFFVAPFVASHYNEAIADMVRIISFTFLLSPIRSTFLVVFKVALQFKLMAGYSFVEEVGKLAVLSVALFVFHLGPTAVIAAYVGADIVALLSFSLLFLVTKKNLFQGNFSLTGWKDPLYTLRAHGKWSVLSSYLGMFGQNIRPWVIKFFLGTEAVGLYGLAVGMYQQTSSVFSVSRVVSPIIPQYLEKKNMIYLLINSAIKYQLLTMVLSAALMAAVFPILINTFFPSYSPAYLLYILLLPSLIPLSFTSIFEPTFHALKAQKNLFFASILRLGILVCLLPITILLFGLYGIAVEFIVTRTVYSCNRYLHLRKTLPGYSLQLSDIFSVTETDRVILRKIRDYFQRKNPYNRRVL
ncbi:MAG: O-antigen/teichoic acid export membrane protein [Acidimicrobiales bacterium]|jgi:O-antigen/teichoic acid export membrane protein